MPKFWVYFLLICMTPLSLAESTKATPEQLRLLELRIQKLQAQMLNTRTQFGHLQRQLQHSEEDIGEIAQRLETIHGALTDKRNTLADLERQQNAQQTQLEAQRQVLAQQIRSARLYTVGEEGGYKASPTSSQRSTMHH